MKYKIFSLAGLVIASVLITSCSISEKNFEKQLATSLDKNPDLLYKVIEKHPERFMEVVQVAANKAKENMAKNRRLKEEQDLESAFNNPLIPEITEDQLMKGPKDAPITIVEYSDFQCPFCARGQQTTTDLMKKYPGKIRFVFKHLPLSFHPQAMISAQYYEAIALQSPKKAFAFHKQLFDNQSKISMGEKFLDSVVKTVGANLDKVKKDIDSPKIKEKIQRDIAEARKFGMQGTPGFLINGIPVKGAYPASHFENIISKLKAKGKLVL